MLKTSNTKFHLRSQPSPLKSVFLFGLVLPLKCIFSQAPPPPHFITLSFTSAHCSYAVFPQPHPLLSFPLSLIILLSFDNTHPSPPPSPSPSPPIKAHLACIRLQSVNCLVHIRYPPQFRI